MELCIKTFDELSSSEIYEILRARAQIFVAEKKMTCVDPDGKDRDCLHAYFWDSGSVTAYLRAEKVNGTTVKIGRVLSLMHRTGLGGRLMRSALPVIAKRLNASQILVHSQLDASGFYEKLGFIRTSDVYMEENVPHISMQLSLTELLSLQK